MHQLKGGSANVRSWRLLALIGLACCLSEFAAAQTTGDQVEESLDQQMTQLEIKQTPIRDALARIERETALRFVLADGVLDRMPYGERTRVSVVIRNMSVRAGMARVLDGLGLEMRVDTGRIIIEPGPVLQRINRRLTINEVNLLSELAGAPWSDTRFGGRTEFRIDPSEKPAERFRGAIANIHGKNAVEQLEAVAVTLGWTWSVEGERVVFEPRSAEIKRRLERTIDLDLQRVALDQTLMDIGRMAGVLIKFEPGALQAVSASERKVDLVQRGATFRQTLERICGATGLRYEIDNDGVLIRAPIDAAVGLSASNIERWVRIEIEIRPGVKMDVFVRQDQLPPKFREEAERKLEAILSGD